MRIISGKYRRRTLHVNPGQTTRPIIDRAKVMLFDHLVDEIENRRVLDLFAGTGSLGLEALSRGAKSVVFLEQDHSAFVLLQKNIAELKAEQTTLCWRENVLRCSFKPKSHAVWYPYDLVFFDPPYPMTKNMQPGDEISKALVRMAKPEVTAENVIMILRVSKHASLQIPEIWKTTKTLEIASMQMHFLNKVT